MLGRRLAGAFWAQQWDLRPYSPAELEVIVGCAGYPSTRQENTVQATVLDLNEVARWAKTDIVRRHPVLR